MSTYLFLFRLVAYLALGVIAGETFGFLSALVHLVIVRRDQKCYRKRDRVTRVHTQVVTQKEKDYEHIRRAPSNSSVA